MSPSTERDFVGVRRVSEVFRSSKYAQTREVGMAGLLDQLSGLLTPENVQALSSATGVKPETLQQGLNVAGPLLQGGLANNASSGAGLDSLTSLLGSVGNGGEGDPLGGIMSMLGGGGGGASAGGGSPMDIVGALGPLLAGSMAGGSGGGGLGGMLGGLLGGGGAAASNDPIAGFVNMALGDGNSAIAKYIDNALGFKITPYLAMAAPFVLGLLKKNSADRGLTPAALAAEIKQGNDEFIAKGGPTAQLLTEAKDAAQQALALKAKFSPDQWDNVMRAPLAAATAVVQSSGSMEPTGAESSAAVDAITSVAESASPTSLFTMAFSGKLNADSFKQFDGSTSRASLLAIVSSAVAAVNSADPGESGPYKALILDVAQKTAEASKEGGFLGFGGKKISEGEADTLAQLRSLLSA